MKHGNRILIFLLSLFFLGVVPAGKAFAKDIQVGILSKYTLSQVRLSGRQAQLNIESVEGSRASMSLEDYSFKVVQDKKMLEIFFIRPQQSSLRIKKMVLNVFSSGSATLSAAELAPYSFAGQLQIRPGIQSLQIKAQVDLESYVASVLQAEMTSMMPTEALKAMAVVIRTYALSPRHAVEGFDFCDLTHCQVYRPRDNVEPSIRFAVAATQGLILTYQGKPIQSLYHANCGGHTSANQKVFGGKPLPYLQGVDDGGYCPAMNWRFSLDRSQLFRLASHSFGENFARSFKDLKILNSEPQGRVFTVSWFADRWHAMPAQEFFSELGQSYGWGLLKSNWFQVQHQGDHWDFQGRGLGHGVGLCQQGAQARALQGDGFAQILYHYFPKTRLQSWRS